MGFTLKIDQIIDSILTTNTSCFTGGGGDVRERSDRSGVCQGKRRLSSGAREAEGRRAQRGKGIWQLKCRSAFGNFADSANSGYSDMKSPTLCSVMPPPKQVCRNWKRAVPPDDDVVYWYSFSNHYTKCAFTQP